LYHGSTSQTDRNRDTGTCIEKYDREKITKILKKIIELLSGGAEMIIQVVGQAKLK
jgi:hypothetical protein